MGKPDKPLHKYDTPDLTDPLVRCDNCSKLVLLKFITRHAGCNNCGNKRYNLVQGITSEEKIHLEQQTYDLGMEYDIDPEYLAIFQPVAA